MYYSLWHKLNIVQIISTMQTTYAVHEIYMKRENIKLQNKNSG